eukprot:362936-Chlamydomonas_euryale.AAC.9
MQHKSTVRKQDVASKSDDAPSQTLDKGRIQLRAAPRSVRSAAVRTPRTKTPTTAHNAQPLNRPSPQPRRAKTPIYRALAEQDRHVPVRNEDQGWSADAR